MKTPQSFWIAVLATGLSAKTLPAQTNYPVVSTGQEKCYDNRSEIDPPKPGEPFYGQDAQHQSRPASYRLSKDGLTVLDQVTGLTWQRAPDTDGDGKITPGDKLTLEQAKALPAKLNAARFGGFDDWRLPTIKEQYSLFDARGTDPDPTRSDVSDLTPFIDTNFFQFAYGDADAGERVIDSQYASSTVFVGSSESDPLLFGVNFADGRIKGYGLKMPGNRDKTFFVQCVRGNPDYGKNDFHANGDGTVSDRATGLMWTRSDSGKGMDWQSALAWVQEKNAENHLGHNDWRLPNVKELQSIVDYTRSPESSNSAAIDPVFESTPITNEAGETDFPFYWSSTTHAGSKTGEAAMYVAFGRAPGLDVAHSGGWPAAARPEACRRWRIAPAPQTGSWRRGRQLPLQRRSRSPAPSAATPKTGDPAEFPHGHGPQGDVIRILNFVRLVRDL